MYKFSLPNVATIYPTGQLFTQRGDRLLNVATIYSTWIVLLNVSVFTQRALLYPMCKALLNNVI